MPNSVAFAVRQRPLYARNAAGRDWKYLALVRTQPCAVCGSWRGVEAAHTGAHGLGQRAPDHDAIPLCRRHHRIGPGSLHALGPARFARAYNLDVAAVIAELRKRLPAESQ